MKDNKNVALKYLTSKKSSVSTVIFGAFLGIGGLLFLFNWVYFGVIGLLIGAIGFIVTNARQIKDEEFEDVLKITLRDNKVEFSSKNVLSVYDISRSPVALAKDKKPKGRYWSACEFFFHEEKCDIVLYDVDIVEARVSEEKYSVPLPATVEVEEKDISIQSFRKKYAYLVIDGSIKIPIDSNSSDSDDVIKLLTKQVKK